MFSFLHHRSSRRIMAPSPRLLWDLSMGQMDGIKKESLMEDKQCCLRVFDRWIICNGTTDYPITWSGLHQLLEDIEHRGMLSAGL